MSKIPLLTKFVKTTPPKKKKKEKFWLFNWDEQMERRTNGDKLMNGQPDGHLHANFRSYILT